MNLYKLYLKKDGVKEILKGVDNNTLAILKSHSNEEEYTPLSNEATENLANNLAEIMEMKSLSGLVSPETMENFDLYKNMGTFEKSKTL